jgi:ribonuclease E
MDSRRDQLQLLEHFTQALADDSARPQIAQLTELGLVELTRKRQGQNIYELFGRACPSCGGLGHVAVLPGRDTLQPLAGVSGVVRSAASARAEVASPVAATAAAVEPGNGGRRRRGGRGGRGAAPAATVYGTGLGGAVEIGEHTVVPLLLDEQPTPVPAAPALAQEAPAAPRRADPELVTVAMDADQELVYGWMGLNPALLLEQKPPSDHQMVLVVRPGVAPEAVLEEARQQLHAAGPRRRRGRGGGSGSSSTSGSSGSGIGSSGSGSGAGGRSANGYGTADEAPASDSRAAPQPWQLPSPPREMLVEITPLPEISEPETVITVTVPTHDHPPESSPPPSSPSPAPAAAAVELAPEVELDESGEPRRRRRRSSAAT